jgi:hypothetical protein
LGLNFKRKKIEYELQLEPLSAFYGECVVDNPSFSYDMISMKK